MQKLSNFEAIKHYFEQTDAIAPEGGKKLLIAEAKQLSASDVKELGQLCAAQLGCEIKAAA